MAAEAAYEQETRPRRDLRVLADDERLVLEVGGRVVKVGVQGGAALGGGARGKIVRFTPESRKRMLDTVARMNFSGAEEWSLITLTYHHAPPPSELKRHLELYWSRIRRRVLKTGFGEPCCMWRVEAQKRGVPHFHLLARMPYVQQAWLQSAWEEIIGQRGMIDVRRASSAKDCGCYVAKYCAKVEEAGPEATDGYDAAQGRSLLVTATYSAADYWKAVGRRWGIKSRAHVPWAEMVEVVVGGAGALKAFYAARRLLRRRSGGTARVFGRRSGMSWYVDHSEPWLKCFLREVERLGGVVEDVGWNSC